MVVVATDTLGQREILSELGSSSRIVPQEDPQALAKAIDSFVCDKNELTRARILARSYYVDNLSWESCTPNLISLIEEVFEGEKP